MNGIYLRRSIVPTVHRILVFGIAMIEEDISIKLRTIAFTPSIRVTNREYLGRSNARLAIYRERRRGVRTQYMSANEGEDRILEYVDSFVKIINTQRGK